MGIPEKISSSVTSDLNAWNKKHCNDTPPKIIFGQFSKLNEKWDVFENITTSILAYRQEN